MTDPKDTNKGDVQITYREDGRVPLAIWVVWLAFAIFAVFYIMHWALPDFQKWSQEAR
jgi:hypothetical protein